MLEMKKIGMAAGTFSVALGIGFVMQNGDALASRFGSEPVNNAPAPFTQTSQGVAAQAAVIPASLTTSEQATEPVPQQVAQAGIAFSSAPTVTAPEVDMTATVELPETAQVPETPTPPVQLAALDAETAPQIDPDVAISEDVSCTPEMMAKPGVAATVMLDVSAPCHVSQSFVLHHQGMMFTAMTDANGDVSLTVPALAEVAVMIAAFGGGDGAVATSVIPDFAMYDRAVLQWQGDTSVMLSAYEGAADYGDPAHIHAMNPGDVARLTSAEGGYLVRLGDASADDALMAEVYTFPSGMIGDASDVTLMAEAEITASNCGSEIAAQSIQVTPTGQTSALDLTMMMPDCDAVGDFLILQNMFEDLTLASR